MDKLTPEIIQHIQYLLNSYELLVGNPLFERTGNPVEEAQRIWNHPDRILVSHGTEAEPILNFGNQIALKRWEMTWEELTSTPSKKTAETDLREAREKMLKDVAEKGFCENYNGVRISKTGKRFWIRNTVIWNVFDEAGKPIGQGASFLYSDEEV